MTDQEGADYSRRSVLKMSGAAMAAGATGLAGTASAYGDACGDADAPSDVRVRSIGESEAQIGWDAPEEGSVDHYVVKAGHQGCSRYGCYISDELKQVTNPDYKRWRDIDGLPPGSDVHFTVSAVFEDGSESGVCGEGSNTLNSDLDIHTTCADVRYSCDGWSSSSGGDNLLGGDWSQVNFADASVSETHGLELEYDGTGGVFSTVIGDDNNNHRRIEDYGSKSIYINVISETGDQVLQDAKLTWDSEDTKTGPLGDFTYGSAPTAGKRSTIQIPLQSREYDVPVPGEFKLKFGDYTTNSGSLSIGEFWIS